MTPEPEETEGAVDLDGEPLETVDEKETPEVAAEEVVWFDDHWSPL
jgi:hypothetical protein